VQVNTSDEEQLTLCHVMNVRFGNSALSMFSEESF
jgi:hypothetical protein